MKQKIIHSIIALTLLLSLSGCGGDDTSSNTTTSQEDTISTKNTISFSGVVVDGYIRGAVVCLDINSNAICDRDEPSTITASDGTFSFTDIDVEAESLIPIIVTGGVDTATDKAFVGELKKIVSSSEVTVETQFTVTPLTDLIASSFMASNTKTVETLAQTQLDISEALGLTVETVKADPMQNKEVFAKVQEVQQVKELILTSALKATDTTVESVEADLLAKNISLSIAESMLTDNTDLNVSAVIIELEVLDDTISIPTNEVTFITAQVGEIQTSLEAMVEDETISVIDLSELQVSLEEDVAVASQNIKEATEETEIVVVVVETKEIIILSTPPSVPTL